MVIQNLLEDDGLFYPPKTSEFTALYGLYFVTVYKEYMTRDKHPLHGYRRTVSTLFQQLAFLRDNGLIPRKFMQLPGLDLSIIEFLYPIEEEAIPTSRKKPEPISEETRPTPKGTKPIINKTKLMYKMYNEWLKNISK